MPGQGRVCSVSQDGAMRLAKSGGTTQTSDQRESTTYKRGSLISENPPHTNGNQKPSTHEQGFPRVNAHLSHDVALRLTSWSTHCRTVWMCAMSPVLHTSDALDCTSGFCVTGVLTCIWKSSDSHMKSRSSPHDGEQKRHFQIPMTRLTQGMSQSKQATTQWQGSGKLK